MFLYTIIPNEVIFGAAEGEEETTSDPCTESEVKQGEVTLLVRQQPDGRSYVSRLISTNPQDYLNPGWQPGSRFFTQTPSK